MCHSKKTTKTEKPKGKQKRVWDNGGTSNDVATLDFSQPAPSSNGDASVEELSAEQVEYHGFDLLFFVEL